MSQQYQFSNDWFNKSAKAIWQNLLPQLKPSKVLEIGSFEGASTCHLIENSTWADTLKITCIDTWEGGIEHQARNIDMTSVEARFDHNIDVAKSNRTNQCEISKLKGLSQVKCAKLIEAGNNSTFDFIYIDGSHQAPDVLIDAINSFQLCRVGGLLAFDDYTWNERLSYGVDPLRSPKIAIDAFTNIFARKIKVINTPNHQLYVQKISD